MTNLVIVGAQWGDEGKGKITDWLAERADYIVRFQGGHNAGHTLVIDGQVFKLSLIPSGIIRKNTISMMGNGVVLEPWVFMKEVETLRAKGVRIEPDNLKLSESAVLVLPIHSTVDQAREKARGDDKIGTTGRGIGPAYEDKVARRAIRVCDLKDHDGLYKKLKALVEHHNIYLKAMNEAVVDLEELFEHLKHVAPSILAFAAPIWRELHQAMDAKKTILFEGAQGVMLDIDHGAYPFVTSSNTLAAQACLGTGMGPTKIDRVLGLVKAYSTRVGSGPFPTELEDAIGDAIRKKGAEFGTVTGRPRRCGWFDAVAVKQAALLNGLTGLAMTKLDVLEGLDEIKICVAYESQGQRLDYLPASLEEQKNIKPIYESVAGWNNSLRGIVSFDELPQTVRNYVAVIEKHVGVPVQILSTSPERGDTILRQDPFSL